MSSIIHVESVEPLAGYRLRLRFSDGMEGEVDFANQVALPPFEPLQDWNLFSQASVRYGAVAWGDDLDIATEFLYARAYGLSEPATFEQAKANELEVSLRELRKHAGLTQTQVAEKTGIDQATLSRLERRDDLIVMLRRYAAGVGAEIEVAAILDGKRYRLRGI